MSPQAAALHRQAGSRTERCVNLTDPQQISDDLSPSSAGICNHRSDAVHLHHESFAEAASRKHTWEVLPTCLQQTGIWRFAFASLQVLQPSATGNVLMIGQAQLQAPSRAGQVPCAQRGCEPIFKVK